MSGMSQSEPAFEHFVAPKVLRGHGAASSFATRSHAWRSSDRLPRTIASPPRRVKSRAAFCARTRSRGRGLPLASAPVVLRGAVQERLDRPRQRELLAHLRGLREVRAEALGLGQVIIAEAGLDVELRVFLRERAHPFFDLAAAVA